MKNAKKNIDTETKIVNRFFLGVLKYNMAGLYSRRINKKHRLVYSIEETTVTVHVLSAWSHYGDR